MNEKFHWWLVAFTFKRNGERVISSMYISTKEQALPPNEIDIIIDKHISNTNNNMDATTEGIVTSVSYLGYMTEAIALDL
jgi:hypothetical protein